MTTLTPNPVYPVAAKDCLVVFTLTESGSNFVRVWVTAAPEGSAYKDQLRKERSARVEIYASDGGESLPFQFRPEVGGKYTLVAQEYAKGSAAGPGFEGDPRGAPSETKVGAEATLSLYIGQRLTMPLGANGDTATLVLYVWNDTIRQTTIEQHGEASPGVVTGSPSTPRAKLAAEATTVLTEMADLIGVTATTAVGTISSNVSNFVTRWNAHLGNVTVHDAADAVNTSPTGLAQASDPSRLREFVNTLLPRMKQHMSNDPNTGTIDGGDYHNTGSRVNDWPNMPVVQSAGSHAEAYAAFADMHRSYEAHRANTSVHNSPADSTALTALPPLAQVHSAFFAVLAANAPTAPAGQSTGAALLISAAGMEEIPL